MGSVSVLFVTSDHIWHSPRHLPQVQTPQNNPPPFSVSLSHSLYSLYVPRVCTRNNTHCHWKTAAYHICAHSRASYGVARTCIHTPHTKWRPGIMYLKWQPAVFCSSWSPVAVRGLWYRCLMSRGWPASVVVCLPLQRWPEETRRSESQG